ncbi:MAG: archaellin, partial [Flavobacteriales bacterium]
MSKSPRVGSLWLALSLVTLLLSGCGDDAFKTVETGEATCSGRSGICELGFSNINFSRDDNEAVATIGNTGGGELEIRSVSFSADASPYLRFTNVTIVNVSNLANWVPTEGDRGFDNSAGPILVTPRDNFEIRVLLSPVDGEILCPGGEVGSSIDCGSIIVVTNDGNNSTITIPIEVSAGASRIEVSPNPLSFSPQQLIDENGGRYAAQERDLTVSNAGATNLTISSIEPSDDFVTVADRNGVSTFPVIVPPGGAAEFVLTWTPINEDPLTAQLTIVSDAVNANASGRTTVLLDSAGLSQPAIEIDPCSFVFPTEEVGTPSQQNFEVRNTGSAALTWSITLIGFTPTDSRSEFAILNSDGATISGNQPSLDSFEVASLTLQHTSTDNRSVSGEMRIAGNFGTPRTCTFSGGPPEARIDVSPTEIWASEVDEGDSLVRTVAIRNAGQAVLDITRIERGAGVTAEYSLSPLDEEGFSLEPGEGRRLEITYLRREDDQ